MPLTLCIWETYSPLGLSEGLTLLSVRLSHMNEGYVIYTHVVSAAEVIYLFLENLLLQQCLTVVVGAVQYLTVGARFVVRLTHTPSGAASTPLMNWIYHFCYELCALVLLFKQLASINKIDIKLHRVCLISDFITWKLCCLNNRTSTTPESAVDEKLQGSVQFKPCI